MPMYVILLQGSYHRMFTQLPREDASPPQHDIPQSPQ